MILIPTPQEAAAYPEEVAAKPELEAVLAVLSEALGRSKGIATWVDQDSIPSALFSAVKQHLARKRWTIESGFNQEENYHFYSLTPCACCHCQ
ncbi:MAG: hypothetical protein SGJ27_09860 [Candidatus Melainabacteria bacterium]|nr:hypothetical protein [Candidatus Melainabacteria bacterium]